MADLTDDQHTRLRELLRSATPLPWHEQGSGGIFSVDAQGRQVPVFWGEAGQGLGCCMEDLVFAVAAINAIAALLDENDRLREENTALGVRWQEQHDRAERALAINHGAARKQAEAERDEARQALTTVAKTVRDVAESLALGAASPASVALAATTLHTACQKAEATS